MFYFEKVASFIFLILPLLIAVAFFTVAERKIMGAIQHRQGPNVTGFLGLLQAVADAVKLMLKETITPTNANTLAFVIAPILTLCLSLLG
jgi:NADH-quinone oxidoreductase subunit H